METASAARLPVGHAGEVAVGEAVIELEPGLWCRASDFAQASAAANRALIACARTALGQTRVENPQQQHKRRRVVHGVGVVRRERVVCAQPKTRAGDRLVTCCFASRE